MTLVAHLSREVGMATCILHQQLGFPEGAHHRLLKIDMLAIVQRHHGYREMNMVGHGGTNGIEVVAVFLKKFPEVGKTLCLGIFAQHFLALLSVEVDIAKSHYLDHSSTDKFVEVLLSTVANTNESHPHLVGFHPCPFTGSHRVSHDLTYARHGNSCRCQTHLLKKLSTSCHSYFLFL